jgi:hypothetical protein
MDAHSVMDVASEALSDAELQVAQHLHSNRRFLNGKLGLGECLPL